MSRAGETSTIIRCVLFSCRLSYRYTKSRRKGQESIRSLLQSTNVAAYSWLYIYVGCYDAQWQSTAIPKDLSSKILEGTELVQERKIQAGEMFAEEQRVDTSENSKSLFAAALSDTGHKNGGSTFSCGSILYYTMVATYYVACVRWRSQIVLARAVIHRGDHSAVCF